MIRAKQSALAFLLGIPCVVWCGLVSAQTGAPGTTVAQTPHDTFLRESLEPLPTNNQTAPEAQRAEGTETDPIGASSTGTLEETFHQADEQFQAANYDYAAKLFTRVWQLAQVAENRERWGRYISIFAFNAATSYRLDRNCDAALMAFSQYTNVFDQLPLEEQRQLRDATDLPADNRAWLNELTKECPTHATNATLGGASLAPTSNEGVQVPLRPSGNWLLDVNLPKPKTHVPKDEVQNTPSRLGWLITAGGAASLAVSGYFVWSGIKNNQNATDPATKHQPFVDYTRARDRDYVTASIVGGLGLGLSCIGIYALATSDEATAIDKPENNNTRSGDNARLWVFTTGTQLGLGGTL